MRSYINFHVDYDLSRTEMSENSESKFRSIPKISVVTVGFVLLWLNFDLVRIQRKTFSTDPYLKQLRTNLKNDLLTESTNVNYNSSKTILWYFPPMYVPTDNTGKVILPKCPELKCFVTTNKTFLPESDAIVFNSQFIKGVPPARKPGQVWVFHNSEVPYYYATRRPYYRKPWSSSFNWTMTYRHDSDIFRPYGLLKRRQNVPVKNYTSIVQKKTRLVAWMVSNCADWSKRTAYVKELQKHIQVDIYGTCGKRVFGRHRNKEWVAYLNETYKFYLAFENNFCLDYITEKLFNNFNLDLVTIVRGGGNYSRDVPPNTYLNVADFKSPKDLSDHLRYLHYNIDRYIDILKQKKRYYYHNEDYRFRFRGSVYTEQHHEQEPMCDLCRRLRDITRYRKTIPDIVPWWKNGLCRKPRTYM
ncbi:3-galactosyl-N-acetylglucosaminide 4-alpha-L-fucosyltransferase FUT3-like [Haliotis asinina]|uniref:3-galactosyl-N-acetylglucosaminide 4-alpha-L-fucosyltransferase FUT3-like n=1 Tax=Haliotis asinina TaxID=109174 RepID=UPI003531EB0F